LPLKGAPQNMFRFPTGRKASQETLGDFMRVKKDETNEGGETGGNGKRGKARKVKMYMEAHLFTE
jgi:hypothetical protein